MTESFIDKFKRGASENAATAKTMRDKAKEAAQKGNQGWNTFKASYNAKTGQTSTPVISSPMPVISRQSMPSIGAGKRRKRKTRKRKRSMKGGKRKSRKIPPPRRRKRKGGHHELLLLGAAGLANMYSKKNKRKSKRKRKSRKKRKTKRRRRRR